MSPIRPSVRRCLNLRSKMAACTPESPNASGFSKAKEDRVREHPDIESQTRANLDPLAWDAPPLQLGQASPAGAAGRAPSSVRRAIDAFSQLAFGPIPERFGRRPECADFV